MVSLRSNEHPVTLILELKTLTTSLLTSLMNDFQQNHKKTINKRIMQRLRSACEQVRRPLSSCAQANVEIDLLFEGVDFFTGIKQVFAALSLGLKTADGVETTLIKRNTISFLIKSRSANESLVAQKFLYRYVRYFRKYELLDTKVQPRLDIGHTAKKYLEKCQQYGCIVFIGIDFNQKSHYRNSN